MSIFAWFWIVYFVGGQFAAPIAVWILARLTDRRRALAALTDAQLDDEIARRRLRLAAVARLRGRLGLF